MTNDGIKPHKGFSIPGPGRKPGFKTPKKVREKISKGVQRHGTYAAIAAFKKGQDNVIDGRTAVGRSINMAAKDLLNELGPSPSRKQQILVDLIRTRLAILHLAGQALTGCEPHELEGKASLLGLWNC